MNTIRYNGINIIISRINEYSREPVSFQDGNDSGFVRHTLSVVGIGDLHTADEDSIRAKLMEPRRSFEFTIGDETILSVPGADIATDDQDGPFPLECSFVIGHGIRIVSWKVSVTLKRKKTNATVSPYLLIQFKQYQRINRASLVEVVTEGVVRFRPNAFDDMETADINDAYKAILPPIPTGFRRPTLELSLNEIGDYMAFRCVDAEQPRKMIA